MKIAILKIGYVSFAFQKPGDASKVLDLLGRAVEVDSTWADGIQSFAPVGGGKFPGCEIRMELVPADRLLKPLKRVPQSRQLGFTPTIESTLP